MILLRSAAFNAVFFGLTALMLLPATVLRWCAPGRLTAYGRIWAGLVIAALRLICGIRVAVIGREHLPADGPALIASQHQSAFDTLVWLCLVPRCAYVVKRELLRIPLFGALILPAGQIAVDRDAGATALRALLRDARAAVADGRQIVIFPEGTRAAPGEELPPQPGVAAIAAATRIPVLPVATDSGRCWSRRAFRKYPGTIHIVIQPPLPPTLPRAELLSELSRAWRDAGPLLDPPVDDSVGSLA